MFTDYVIESYSAASPQLKAARGTLLSALQASKASRNGKFAAGLYQAVLLGVADALLSCDEAGERDQPDVSAEQSE